MRTEIVARHPASFAREILNERCSSPLELCLVPGQDDEDERESDHACACGRPGGDGEDLRRREGESEGEGEVKVGLDEPMSVLLLDLVGLFLHTNKEAILDDLSSFLDRHVFVMSLLHGQG